ncbi:helix-turn-helix domain-containing protein [Streptomyces europaeiscabiei]|uniref:helix-turn-helix domain-containing protein n=1 Tax=Streptomyces europaeiscabiei TaxID=146819 RepID=UPI0029A53791|nr:helix-turn-helix domain-containing protein [Streptomyces europaeiscabiei]MDX3709959.1 helix-turn-helix domain-containing protein [Streptomyces europaeiscabiei]MDX3861510.1 helix-turn-helix domain-containing protein [Streptomyces europaeiscabiei]MDX3874709.1 helix-turn-helix domain-containing protein [Streptomyces europaeiscabiei]
MDAIHDDVAEFALLLARLKERTDRSYAALARHLGTNASTLHRYCAGEAVPKDFTGVERFAALCGASPEERVELHRRWILAVAARQRARPSDARRSSTPQDTTSTAVSASASALASAASASHSSPTDEAPEPTSPADPRPAPTSPAKPRPGPTSPADRRPHAGRPRRRPVRSTVLAASLAIALAGLTASASGPPSGGGESAASARTTPEPSASATYSGGGPQSAAVSPSGGGESSASAPATSKPSASATLSDGDPQKNPASASPVPPSVPLTWTANSQLWQLDCDHDYVIDKPPQQVPPPPLPADAEAWAASLGAVHGRTTNLRISVQGRGSAAVVLEALHVRVAGRTTPAAGRGIAYSTYEGCGATLIPRYFSVNLDAHRPLARSMPGNDPDRPAPAIGFPYQVSLREPEVLMLAATTESCTCDWYLELDWSSQGRTGTVRIDDHGRPFRTTSIEGLPHYWHPNPRGWVPMTTTHDETETGD